EPHGSATAEPHGEATAAPTEAHSEATPAEATAEPTSEPTTAPTVSPTPAAMATPEPTAEGTAAALELSPATLFLGYIPNIQFAPVYVAYDLGYFREVGIDLTIEHGFDETDGLTRIAAGKLTFGMISGEQVILARAAGAPVKYVYRWYQKFPVGLVMLEKNAIKELADLKGKTLGVPGLFGASYVGLQALLKTAGVSESEVTIKAIGFEPVPVICSGGVDASVVYISNEPAQVEKTCGAVTVIPVAEYANLVSNGLVVGETLLKDDPAFVRRAVAAFNRGLAKVIEDPALAYEISRKYVETLGADDAVQRNVLAKSIDLWKAERLGANDAATWTRTAETLLGMGLIQTMPDVAAAYTDDFLP
ncbi:MAG TPA: ABC transporter substrate-binding protein, partial [Aggregatilineales bacterium]|nr:ABC transporter substrate-binding protein [Aggregatilineales bacterium]